MGDRGNAGITFSNGQTIYLYGHWLGFRVMQTFARGLERASRAGRMDDESYAARLIFQEWTRGAEDENLSFGIGPDYAGDCEHPIPVLRFKTQDVAWSGKRVPDSKPGAYDGGWKPGEDHVLSVADFIQRFYTGKYVDDINLTGRDSCEY